MKHQPTGSKMPVHKTAGKKTATQKKGAKGARKK